ncbi:MAG: HAMP domain-containing sensor histidine kinase [Lachnospiraceae bacterium]|nr:HAMP domain-containing sensor histidine kinase [Lachnospiraceae bacterium]
MRILANKRLRALLDKILISMLIFILASAAIVVCGLNNAAFYILLCALVMCLAILAVCYGYFSEQHEIMENAIMQITDYISGNREARIACDEEGELYRLFHEVNTLAAILNAHAENEKRSKQFLKNTISDISHQLKTPLAALNIYNGLIQGEAEELPELQELASLSEKELDRIEMLVQNLLKITKLDAGSIVFEKTSENVADMMGEIELHFAYRAKQEQKELILSGDEHISLLCDRDWMIEALENIVKNAFDHTDSGELVQIEWKTSASMVQIIIKDNGSGIHPEDLHHIFKRFYRSRFSKDKQGVGLGLPLTKMIVEAHNGTIEVDSELGIGTSFILNFIMSYEENRFPTKL